MEKSFICANSSDGFVFLKEEIMNYDTDRVFVIKGGPGTGKSTLIKNMVKKFGAKEVLYCSSDPSSLDGAVLKDGTVIFDGTAPHLVDPLIPIAGGNIINVCDCIDQSKLSERKNDIRLLKEKSDDCYKKGYALLKAAGECENLVYNYAKAEIDIEKIEKYCKSLIKRRVTTAGSGKIKTRFLDAISGKGIVTLPTESKDTAVICGNIGIADAIMKKTAEVAAESNIDVTLYLSPLIPNKISHIMLGNNDLFLTTDYKNKSRRINTERFMTEKTHKNGEMSFYQRLADSAVDAACEQFNEAMKYHKETEKIYVSALNTRLHDDICRKTAEKLS